MITIWAARMTLVALLLSLVAGCGREQQDWRSAEGADTSEAYARFLEQHADSELANQARLRMAQLQEERDWRHADAAATVEAYRQFLAQHHGSKWAEQARIRIEGFSLGSAPRTDGSVSGPVSAGRTGVRALWLATGVASSAPAPAASADPAAAPAARVTQAADLAQPAPASPETRGPATRPASEGYGIQLGAFGTQASADREWQRLQGRFGSQLSGLAPRIVVAGSDSGPLYRLQAPTRGEAQARALCNALNEQSQACVPVIPR